MKSQEIVTHIKTIIALAIPFILAHYLQPHVTINDKAASFGVAFLMVLVLTIFTVLLVAIAQDVYKILYKYFYKRS